MRALITGGTGFIGSNLALALAAEGHDIVLSGMPHEQELPDFRGTVLYGDMQNIDWDAVGSIDAVFHEGAISDTRLHDRDHMLRVNVDISKIVFKRAVEHGAKHIVYASSAAVYGNVPTPFREDGPLSPLTPYGESKVLLDKFAIEFAREHADIRIVGLRYSNVYGPHEDHKGNMSSIIRQCAHQMLSGSPRLFEHGEQKRDYVYVKDVVRANILALHAKESCVVNCASGVATSFNDLIALLNRVLGLSREPEYIPNPYGRTYQSHTECDTSLAKEKLGFSVEYDIERGIKDYFDSGFLLR